MSNVENGNTRKPYSMRLSEINWKCVTSCYHNIYLYWKRLKPLFYKPFSTMLPMLPIILVYIRENKKYTYIINNVFFYVYIIVKKKWKHGNKPLRASSGAGLRRYQPVGNTWKHARKVVTRTGNSLSLGVPA